MPTYLQGFEVMRVLSESAEIIRIKRKKVGTNKGEKALDKISKAQIKI